MGNNENAIEEINQNELPFTIWVVIAWAFWWRGVILTVAGYLFSVLVSLALGYLIFILGLTEVWSFRIFRLILGFGIGLSFLILQLKWFFKTNFYDFRIAILKKNVQQAVQADVEKTELQSAESQSIPAVASMECAWCEEQVFPTNDGFCPACNRPIA